MHASVEYKPEGELRATREHLSHALRVVILASADSLMVVARRQLEHDAQVAHPLA